MVAQEVQHLGEGGLGGNLDDLVLAAGVVGAVLVAHKLRHGHVQGIAQALQHGLAGGGLLRVLQLGEIGDQLDGVDILMEGVGGVVGHGVLVLGAAQGEDHVLAAYALTAVHRLLVLHLGKVDVVAEDEVECLIPLGHSVVPGEGALRGDLHLVVEVDQPGVHVEVGHVGGVLVGLDGVGGGVVVLDLPEVQRVGVPLGLVDKVVTLKGFRSGGVDADGVAIHHVLVVRLHLAAHVQRGDIRLVQQDLLDLGVQGDGLVVHQGAGLVNQGVQTLVVDVAAQVGVTGAVENSAGGVVAVAADGCPAGEGDVVVAGVNLGHIGTAVGLHVDGYIKALLGQQVAYDVQVLLVGRLAQKGEGDGIQLLAAGAALHVVSGLYVAAHQGQDHYQAEYARHDSFHFQYSPLLSAALRR